MDKTELIDGKYYDKAGGYPTDNLVKILDDRQLLTHLGVPLRYQARAIKVAAMIADWDEAIPPKVMEWIDLMPYIFRPQYDKSDENPDLCGMGLAIFGPSGTGKTTLAAAILLHMVRKGIRNADPSGHSRWYGQAMGQFVSWQEVSAMFREGITDEDIASDLADIKMRMTPLGLMENRGDFLVLDDISRESATTFNVSNLARFLRRRTEHGYPTIITTNHPPEKWTSIYGDVMGSFMSRSFLMVEVA